MLAEYTSAAANISSEPSVSIVSAASRPPARQVKRKTRITIYLDDEVLEQFRSLSEQSGMGYQTLINAALRTRLVAVQPELASAA
jgi:uncharacterized protein (DUF4415 family)